MDYMVDEVAQGHLTPPWSKDRMGEARRRAGLEPSLRLHREEASFTQPEVAILIAAIDASKILDPACGSGAFPMGVLHKLVPSSKNSTPATSAGKKPKLAKLDSPSMREELERAFAENNDDYGRKLSLVENCLYGVDIQPIAIQITKLRFFISWSATKNTNRDKAKNLASDRCPTRKPSSSPPIR
ncbi:MAG: hypothetical protein IPL99_23940 [Candidatus Competibacteraceae bacterium]|nr:hypothetical protein [Candidatus Competibacteraceae bacterium]